MSTSSSCSRDSAVKEAINFLNNNVPFMNASLRLRFVQTTSGVQNSSSMIINRQSPGVSDFTVLDLLNI